MNCLSLCLKYITGKSLWRYSFYIPHKWKYDIKEIGRKRGYYISYLYSLDILQKIYHRQWIQIYNTKRGTTHAVIKNYCGKIVYNPYLVEDLTTENGVVTVTKK